MKNFFFSLLAFTAFSAQATIRTVNNNPAGLAQFNDIQSAINASSSGDSIYVHASATNYGNADIVDKKITLIGPGISPDRSMSSLQANINFIQIVNMNSFSADGSVIMGMHITQELRVSNNGSGNVGNPVNSVRVIRNRFTNAVLSLYVGNNYGSIIMNNLLVEGNYFQNSSVSAASSSYYFTNCTVINNVFARSNGFGGSIENFNNCTNVVFDHNLFYGNQVDGNRLFGNSANGFSLKNNVFVNCVTHNTHPNGMAPISNIYFQNNITFNCTNNSPWNFNTNIDGGGNISQQNPQLGSQSQVDAGTYNPLLDFSITTGPANNSATDGKDMGVLFEETSTMNWAYGRNTRLPYIHTINLLNSSVPAGGTLNVQIQARKAK
ncbi:MAG: hypothetical protein JNJ58_12210 [Chitinophagaceae bacterium]|nr:hypothetical protein [Chitinophagaceae bacterium]